MRTNTRRSKTRSSGGPTPWNGSPPHDASGGPELRPRPGGGQDQALLTVVTSANIACGFHAGDAQLMRQTVRMAVEKGVGLGAHPGLPDREGFGRRALKVEPAEAFSFTLYQIGALQAFAALHGQRLRHVKPHGALYTMASRDAALAEALAGAVRAADPDLILFGLAGRELVKAGRQAGLRVAEEAFADRGYRPDGTLVPRDQPDALVHDPEVAARRAVRMVREGAVAASDGSVIALRADTICIHGDTPGAAAVARSLHARLTAEGIEIRKAGEA